MAHVEDLVQSQVVLEAEGIVGWSVNPYEVASLVVKLVFELSHPQRGFNSPVNVVTNKQHMRIAASMFPERFDLVASLPRGPQNLSIVSVSEITGHLFGHLADRKREPSGRSFSSTNVSPAVSKSAAMSVD